ESISEALIAKWLKRVGETIAVDEPVVDLETDKVSVSINAPSAGVLAEQRFAEGATVKVGDVVGAISSEPEVQPKANPAAKSVAVEKPAPTPVVAQKAEPEHAVQLLQGSAAPQVVQASHPSPSVRKALREGAQ